MKVTNNTSYELIAFGWYKQYGYGDDVHILPEEIAEVNGPSLCKIDGGMCSLLLSGDIVCHEEQDNEHGFYVGKGVPLNLDRGDSGVTVRHHTESPEKRVISWRKIRRLRK